MYKCIYNFEVQKLEKVMALTINLIFSFPLFAVAAALLDRP